MQANKQLTAIAVALALTAVAFVARAETVGALDDIQAQTILYKAKGELAKARREAAETSGLTETVESELPVVTKVFGGREGLKATLLFVGGGRRDVGINEVAPGGYRVTHIALNRVTVTRNGRIYSLAFSNSAPVAAPKEPKTSGPNVMMPSFAPPPIAEK